MNKNIIFVLLVAILCSLVQLSLRLDVDWMQYARTDISEQQWWRFLSGNFVHLTWRHLGMNALALMAIVILFPKSLTAKGLALALLVSGLSTTLGLWVFSPDVHWYVGLSGALHGLLATLIIVDYVLQKHWLNILLLVVLIAKLCWEGMMGPMPGSESAAGGPIVVQAHLYGFIGGLLISTYILIKNNKLEK